MYFYFWNLTSQGADAEELWALGQVGPNNKTLSKKGKREKKSVNFKQAYLFTYAHFL